MSTKVCESIFSYFISEFHEQIFMNIWTGRRVAYTPKFCGGNVISICIDSVKNVMAWFVETTRNLLSSLKNWLAKQQQLRLYII
jgi:hypothetical protein